MIIYTTELKNINHKQLEGFFVGWTAPLDNKQHYEVLKNSTFFVAAIDDNTNMVIGFITALSDMINGAFIRLLEVLPEYQNKGIGTKLMKTMLELLDNITCIDLICNENMQGFYEQFSMLKIRGMAIRKYLIKDDEKNIISK